MVYQFKPGGTFKKGANAQEVGVALASIQKECGRLESTIVLERARDAESPLHGCFTWDDSIAAQAYRLDQARSLIKAIVVVRDGETEPKQAYYNVRITTTTTDGSEVSERYYQDATVMVKNPKEYESALEVMQQELKAALRGLNELKEIAPRNDRHKIRKAQGHTEAAMSALA